MKMMRVETKRGISFEEDKVIIKTRKQIMVVTEDKDGILIYEIRINLETKD